MIYGANGYTAQIIIKVAKKQGMEPILAGRNRNMIEELAEEHGLECSIFELGDSESVIQALKGIDIILNCAGPFSKTAETLMDACLKTSTHYLDITGEIDVFEHAHSLDEGAREASVILCPGVGFDVIPTDCLAAYLKEALPDAESLALAFQPVGSKVSPGTAKTAVEGAAKGGRVRKGGELVSVPFAYKTREIDFGRGSKLAATISWGDVSTAYYTTGIPDIEVYLPMSQKSIKRLRKRRKYIKLLALPMVQRFLKRRIDKNVKGQGESERREAKMILWGEVCNHVGKKVAARFATGDGYDVTAMGAVAAVETLMSNSMVGGFKTPSKLMGVSILDQLPGFTGIEMI
tara:strand:+ start:1231 stop:2274 length:1044 start_codon:yes stop_codon:yes gene_type:complete